MFCTIGVIFHRPVTVPKTYTPSGTGTGISGNVGAQANLQEINTFAQVQEAMEKEYKALILTNDQRAIQEAVIEKTNQLRQAGVELSPLEIAQLTSATEKMQALTEQTALFGSSIDRVMQGASDAISQFVATGRVDFKSLVSSMIQDIARLATQQYILKPISNILNTFVGGLLGGAAPTLFPTVAPSPHFATGGGFTVGGTGGVDSQLIQMRASPGERVRVSRAGQEGNSGSGATIIFNISTPDVAGFKATQSQIAARMSRLVNHGSRNS